MIRPIDDCPSRLREVLERTPVTVTDRGPETAPTATTSAPPSPARQPDQIVIYRDTLERDFGHDPELLRAQVERAVRHELAHHLGWDERGVRGPDLSSPPRPWRSARWSAIEARPPLYDELPVPGHSSRGA